MSSVFTFFAFVFFIISIPTFIFNPLMGLALFIWALLLLQTAGQFEDDKMQEEREKQDYYKTIKILFDVDFDPKEIVTISGNTTTYFTPKPIYKSIKVNFETTHNRVDIKTYKDGRREVTQTNIPIIEKGTITFKKNGKVFLTSTAKDSRYDQGTNIYGELWKNKDGYIGCSFDGILVGFTGTDYTPSYIRDPWFEPEVREITKYEILKLTK